MAASQWHEATPTQLRLAREHAERMKRWQDVKPPAPPPPVIKIRSITPQLAPILPSDRIELWLASWRMPPMLSAHLIQGVVAGHYNTTRAKLLSTERLARYVLARHVAMWLCLEMLKGASLPTVGRWFHRDHTMVLHGRNGIRTMIADNPGFAAMVEELRQRIKIAAEPAL